jgi:lipid A disaccharide synthetase
VKPLHDENGEIYTVRYDAVNAMLLNEFLKEHCKVQELEAALAQQREESRASAAQQQKGIEALAASVRQQAAQIEKVSAELELSKATPQIVTSTQ